MSPDTGLVCIWILNYGGWFRPERPFAIFLNIDAMPFCALNDGIEERK